MSYRKILYGYQIQNGELTVSRQEAAVVERITTLYISGVSYQKIADTLNSDHIPFNQAAPLWNKHKVKRLLENPRYTGVDGYPAIIGKDVFLNVQEKIRRKAVAYIPLKSRSALGLMKYLHCEQCGGSLHRTAGPNRRKDTLYLKCEQCSLQMSILDADLLDEISRQMAEHDSLVNSSYIPSGEVICLTNAINRGLEHPDAPEDMVSLILQGISARYGCCPSATKDGLSCRSTEIDTKNLAQAVSHITISSQNHIRVNFK